MEYDQCLLVWRCCAWWDGVMDVWLDNCRRVSPWLLLGSICSVRYRMNTSISKHQKLRAGMSFMRKPASRENDFSFCRTVWNWNLFLAHPTLDTIVWLPNKHQYFYDVDFESSQSVCHKILSISLQHAQACSQTTKYQVSLIRAKYRHLRTFCEQTVDNSPTKLIVIHACCCDFV